MKKRIIALLAVTLVAGSAYGCSREARDSAKELGNDMKRDVKEAGRDIRDAAQDATD